VTKTFPGRQDQRENQDHQAAAAAETLVRQGARATRATVEIREAQETPAALAVQVAARAEAQAARAKVTHCKKERDVERRPVFLPSCSSACVRGPLAWRIFEQLRNRGEIPREIR
jgi:hypothetical protein